MSRRQSVAEGREGTVSMLSGIGVESQGPVWGVLSARLAPGHVSGGAGEMREAGSGGPGWDGPWERGRGAHQRPHHRGSQLITGQPLLASSSCRHGGAHPSRLPCTRAVRPLPD